MQENPLVSRSTGKHYFHFVKVPHTPAIELPRGPLDPDEKKRGVAALDYKKRPELIYEKSTVAGRLLMDAKFKILDIIKA
ncbi:hypothetical protein RvY_09315 [Ramazzottius varieornatus]|uniref:Uncharacterized protein n=1 Tax=Ramazzottius varieornatus TaxID=947166 RepID=A0A1D1VGV1_RAMVA|nr:hypothetical protein RvY_09315 [Ramazzottius varieornatus]